MACGQDYKLSAHHKVILCVDGRCHKQDGDKPGPDRCLACHPEISRAQKERRGLHAQPEIIEQPSCAKRGQCHYEHRTGVLLPAGWQDELRSAGVHARISGFELIGAHAKQACEQCHKPKDSGRVSYLNASSACVSCHAKDSPHGAVRVANLDCQRCHTSTGWKSRLQFDHQRETQYPLEGKHQQVPCSGCHIGLKFRMSIARYADCSPCHQSKHGGSFGLEACRTCHTAARDFMDTLPFDHGRTRFPLTGGHDLARMKNGCQTCHKPGANFVPALECSSCHRNNPHQTRFNRQPQCSACHVGTTWTESAFDHGTRTRFQLTANHVAPTLKECRPCHRGKDPSDFEDLRGLVTGSSPAKSFLLNCLGCHEHKKAHKGQFTSGQCLNCHERPGSVQPKACRGPNGNRDEACLNRMAWFGHGPGKPFPLTGGHDLARMKNKCLACHSKREEGQGFAKIPSGCVNCHGEKDPHRQSLGTKCENCHAPRTGRWKDRQWFRHDRNTSFPLQGAHEQAPCESCHRGTDLSTRFTLKKGPEVPTCGDVLCHKKDDTCHEGKQGNNCGAGAGCHDPRDNSFIREGQKCTKL